MASATSSSSSRHTSLRLRIALALALLSVLGIFTMALALVMALDQSQEEFIDNELASQIAYSMKIWRDSPTAAFPNTPDMRLYRLGTGATTGAASATVPSALARLPVGNHEIMVDGREHHVAVREDDSGRYILAYDVEATEDRERAMFASVVIASLVIGLVALGAGYLISGGRPSPRWLPRTATGPARARTGICRQPVARDSHTAHRDPHRRRTAGRAARAAGCGRSARKPHHRRG
jgi:hypothetical protein